MCVLLRLDAKRRFENAEIYHSLTHFAIVRKLLSPPLRHLLERELANYNECLVVSQKE